MSTTNPLEEAGLALVSSRQLGTKQGTEYLDRTIYYAKQKTDSEGRTVVDGAGKPIVELRVYRTVGSWLTPSMYEKALQIEKDFANLNKVLRDDMERKDIKWRIPKNSVTMIEIQGF